MSFGFCFVGNIQFFGHYNFQCIVLAQLSLFDSLLFQFSMSKIEEKSKQNFFFNVFFIT